MKISAIWPTERKAQATPDLKESFHVAPRATAMDDCRIDSFGTMPPINEKLTLHTALSSDGQVTSTSPRSRKTSRELPRSRKTSRESEPRSRKPSREHAPLLGLVFEDQLESASASVPMWET